MLGRIPIRSWSFARVTIMGICLLQLVLAPAIARAADNIAVANIAGVDADLNDSNTITLTSNTLGIVKAAFLSNGTPITSGSTLARGTVVKFVIYLDNTTAAPIDSVNISDVLAATFSYQAGTMKVDTSQNTGATVANIFTAVNATAALTDVVSAADVAGVTGSTVSAGGGAGNGMVTAPAGKVWALLFTVKMQ